MPSFSKNLRQFRNAAGMTQDDLAQKLNISRQAISAWERGCTEPDIQTLMMLAQILNVDANELLFGRKANNESTMNKADWNIIAISSAVTLIILLLQFILYTLMSS